MAARLQAILNHLAGITPNVVIADSMLATILHVGLPGVTASAAELKTSLFGLTKESARVLLEKLAAIIHNVHDKTGPFYREAYRRALESAQAIKGFAKDHPVFCLVIALGVLYIMAPAVIQLLGFTSKGPALGTLSLHQ